MILLTFHHGLRAAEVCDLHWDLVQGAPSGNGRLV
jgi:hypothetical protein